MFSALIAQAIGFVSHPGVSAAKAVAVLPQVNEDRIHSSDVNARDNAWVQSKERYRHFQPSK